MKFKLVQKKSTKQLTTFHVLNERGDICGSVGVAPNEANDLLKHWVGAREERREPEMKAPSMKKMSSDRVKRAVLRGC